MATALWVPAAEVCSATGLSRHQLRQAVKRGTLRPGVHYLPGPTPNSPRKYKLAAVWQLLLSEQTQQRCAVIGTSSGAGFLPHPSAELIAQVRREGGPAVIASPTGCLAYGQDTVGNESVTTVDLANGELAMANTDGEEVKQPLDLPTLASLAGLCSRAVTAAQEQGAQGRSPRKAEPITHRGLGLTVWAAHPDDGHARIQLGGLEQRMHGLVLLQLVAELHALVARATAKQLQIRKGLEKLMAAPDTKAPALAWERSHGEG